MTLQALFTRPETISVRTNVFVRKDPRGPRVLRLAKKHGVGIPCILFHMFNDAPEGSCANCEKPTKFRSFKQGYSKFCSSSCRQTFWNRDEGMKERRAKICLRKYGTRTPAQNALVREKVRVGTLRSYDRDHAGIIAKRRKTTRKHYGVDHHLQSEVVRKRIRKTCLRKYGVDNTWKSPHIKAKIARIMMLKYGYRHPAQCPDIHARIMATSFSTKTVTIDGKIFVYQGYELPVIKRLCELFGAENVLSDPRDVPEIYYRDCGIKRRYYADVLVGRRVYEVKSTYTLGLDSPNHVNKFYRARAKARATVKAGYNFKCIIMSPKGRVLLVTDLELKYRELVVALSTSTR